MRHLPDDQLYDLAIKVAQEEDFTSGESRFLLHIAECDECYHLMCCMMAMQEVSRNIGEYMAREPVPVGKRITAVIRLAVNAVNTTLDQLDAGSWIFRSAPMALAGARSLGRRSVMTIKKLTDPNNSQNFVAYDTAKQLLMIQIDSTDCPAPPRAVILLSDGREIEVSFEKRAHLFWAEIPGLSEGEYEISMEK